MSAMLIDFRMLSLIAIGLISCVLGACGAEESSYQASTSFQNEPVLGTVSQPAAPLEADAILDAASEAAAPPKEAAQPDAVSQTTARVENEVVLDAVSEATASLGNDEVPDAVASANRSPSVKLLNLKDFVPRSTADSNMSPVFDHLFSDLQREGELLWGRHYTEIGYLPEDFFGLRMIDNQHSTRIDTLKWRKEKNHDVWWASLQKVEKPGHSLIAPSNSCKGESFLVLSGDYNQRWTRDRIWNELRPKVHSIAKEELSCNQYNLNVSVIYPEVYMEYVQYRDQRKYDLPLKYNEFSIVVDSYMYPRSPMFVAMEFDVEYPEESFSRFRPEIYGWKGHGDGARDIDLSGLENEDVDRVLAAYYEDFPEHTYLGSAIWTVFVKNAQINGAKEREDAFTKALLDGIARTGTRSGRCSDANDPEFAVSCVEDVPLITDW